MNSNQAHQINESHLGTDATPEQAQRLAEILTGMGYAAEYNAMHGVTCARRDDETDEIVEIPRSAWDAAVAQVLATKMSPIEISRKASDIAGALWDDRDKTGTLAEQLRAVANEPSHGTDGDLTEEDRAELLKLADASEAE